MYAGNTDMVTSPRCSSEHLSQNDFAKNPPLLNIESLTQCRVLSNSDRSSCEGAHISGTGRPLSFRSNNLIMHELYSARMVFCGMTCSIFIYGVCHVYY